MEKKKLNLKELEVKSFTTRSEKVKGGHACTPGHGCPASHTCDPVECSSPRACI